MKEICNDQYVLFNALNSKMTLSDFQSYFKKILNIRGFNEESIEKKLLLLVEEVGELVKAVRKEQNVLGIDYGKLENYDTVKGELADVLIVLIAICNLLQIDLYEALYEKEKVNIERRWSK